MIDEEDDDDGINFSIGDSDYSIKPQSIRSRLIVIISNRSDT